MNATRPAATRVLLTGASSGLGRATLEALLASGVASEIWTLSRRACPHPDPRVVPWIGDLGDSHFAPKPLGAAPSGPLNLVLHFAGVTHAQNPDTYVDVNTLGTERLALWARTLACRRLVYISTRCATADAGAYGISKLRAEHFLRELSWEALVIVRPSEVYGYGGKEGVDALLRMAERFHVVPLLFGEPRIAFAPISCVDFVEKILSITHALLGSSVPPAVAGINEVELCGPEILTGLRFALRIARTRRAVPVPVWWPALQLGLRVLQRFRPATAPDQIPRLLSRKTAERPGGWPGVGESLRRFPN